MEILYIQVIIFITIILSSLIGGKKATLMATAIWIVETFLTYKISRLNYIQIITVSLSFQIGIIIGVVRDLIIKKLKKAKE